MEVPVFRLLMGGLCLSGSDFSNFNDLDASADFHHQYSNLRTFYYLCFVFEYKANSMFLLGMYANCNRLVDSVNGIHTLIPNIAVWD